MSEENVSDEIRKMPGMVYIFLTSERPVSHEEIDDLCIKVF